MTTHHPLRSALALAAALALSSACSRPKPAAPARPPIPVSVAVAHAADVPVLLEAVGAAQARTEVAVRSRVGGVITRVGFTEGQDVRKGDVLFEIDRRPYAAALAQAEAALARDRALAENARADAARFADLAAKDYVTRSETEAAASRAASLEAVLKADEAAVDEARLRLADATLRAPIDGRTGQLLVHAGNLVKADDAQPLVVVRQLRPIDVAFSVPEQSLPEIRRRMSEGALRVEATPRGDDSRAAAPIEGELTFVDNAVDRASGTILLKASFPNDDGQLWPGEFVDVRLRLRTLQGVVVVPSQAVQAGQQGAFAFVVGDDATAQMRPLRVGPTVGGMTVVESGVAPGERVIVDGQIQLGPGAKVEVKDASAAPVASEAGR